MKHIISSIDDFNSLDVTSKSRVARGFMRQAIALNNKALNYRTPANLTQLTYYTINRVFFDNYAKTNGAVDSLNLVGMYLYNEYLANVSLPNSTGSWTDRLQRIATGFLSCGIYEEGKYWIRANSSPITQNTPKQHILHISGGQEQPLNLELYSPAANKIVDYIKEVVADNINVAGLYRDNIDIKDIPFSVDDRLLTPPVENKDVVIEDVLDEYEIPGTLIQNSKGNFFKYADGSIRPIEKSDTYLSTTEDGERVPGLPIIENQSENDQDEDDIMTMEKYRR